jgi:hypothetical protein
VTRLAWVLVALASAACIRPHDEVQEAKLGDLRFNVPLHWTHTDSTRPRLSSLWVPEDNPHKESVEVVETPLGPGLGDGHNLSQLEDALEHAQISLPQAHVGSPMSFITASGQAATMLSADFVPQGASKPYRRLHAMIVDGKSVIHVLYTAAVADDNATAFQTVLQTIHHQGA